MNQFRPVTLIAWTTPGTHNPRISPQIVINHLREIGERPPYTMYVLYAVFLFWPSICNMTSRVNSFQSTRPVGRVLWKELLVLSRFHS